MELLKITKSDFNKRNLFPLTIVSDTLQEGTWNHLSNARAKFFEKLTFLNS